MATGAYRHVRTAGALLGATLCAVLCLVGDAHASVSVGVAGDTLLVTADGTANDLEIGRQDIDPNDASAVQSAYVVDKSGDALIATTPECQTLPAQPSRGPSVVCRLFGGPVFVDKANIELGAGSDRLLWGLPDTIDRHTLADSIRPNIDGGDGDDTVIGTSGEGMRVLGGLGNDHLVGSCCLNVFLGGPGNDLLDLANRNPDRKINCGPGRDRAKIDAGFAQSDPKPRGCESVKKRRP